MWKLKVNILAKQTLLYFLQADYQVITTFYMEVTKLRLLMNLHILEQTFREQSVTCLQKKHNADKTQKAMYEVLKKGRTQMSIQSV